MPLFLANGKVVLLYLNHLVPIAKLYLMQQIWKVLNFKVSSSPSNLFVCKRAAQDQGQHRAADHERTPDAGDVDGLAVLNAGIFGSVSAAEHGGIGNHITAGFGNLSGVVRRHRVPGGVLAGGAASVPGRGGVAGDHALAFLLSGVAPLHIRQGQAPPTVGDGLGHQGEVRIRES